MPSEGTSDTSNEIESKDNEAVASAVHAQRQAELERRYREYQQSLWELQRSSPQARPPGSPPYIYPQLDHTAGQTISGGGALG